MSQTITINLPDETKNALDAAANEEGLSESALIEKALSDYLFILRFRSHVRGLNGLRFERQRQV